ncbi:FdrA family protein [Nocardioides cynanchi]|uniref:FdrA family protein n=1 Tax=Nocardioides cynanchi TaxID=2558918 RepID=UPI0012482483|nr:FdrA family protein [Nocardioides cynanchi]
MTDHVELRAGAYADSVTLLQISRRVQDLPGVLTAQVAMATPLNLEVLERMGFEIPADAGVNHLVVAVRLETDDLLDEVRAEVDRALTERRTTTDERADAPPRTTGSALLREPGALVVVSVPGASAAVEAMDALEAGSDVMVFSDHVPVDQEVALKRYAADRGLLVMGPDSGTAVVGGVGLGFANVVAPGPVGIVAASGTGCQQVLALLDHAGVGVSTAYGVGGRDLSAEVGGLATLTALGRLDADPATRLVVLVSKPPDEAVGADLATYTAGLGTPVLTALLGAGRPDLTAATEQVLDRLGHRVPRWPVHGRANPGSGTRLHGLFVGGTLKAEADVLVTAAGVDAELVDFGDDAYTEGRAHPMIDPSLRLARLAEVAADPATGVVLLDVVLGHGAEPDPAAALAPALRGLRPPVVVTVVGTAHDPQGLDRQVDALVAAGAEVHLSNAGATRRAIALLGGAR